MSIGKFYCLVAGSRDFNDFGLLEKELDSFIRENFTAQDVQICIISGGARGADRLAERYAHIRGFELRVFPADWNTYGRSAGYRRNEQMHQFIAQFDNRACICFWDGASRGTQHNFGLAERFHTPLKIIRFDSTPRPVGSIRIVNMRTYNREDNEVFVKVDRTSILGNPFRMQNDSNEERDRVCDEYADYFDANIANAGKFRNEVQRIIGIVKAGRNVALGCWCAPKRCHAEHIKAYIETHI